MTVTWLLHPIGQVGTEAESFFPGLPATDLRKSNVTLAALKQRVNALCSSASPGGGTELNCSWSFHAERVVSAKARYALPIQIVLLFAAGNHPAEFCLMSYRPRPDDPTDTGVAYRICATACLTSR